MTIQQRTLILRAEGRHCEVDGCCYQRKPLSRYCYRHWQRDYRTGHPLGVNVTQKELRPFLPVIREFIEGHADHPAMAAALDWLADLLADAKPPFGAMPKGRNADPKVREDAWLVKLREQGVQPIDILTLVTAILWLEGVEPHRFPSLRYRDNQVGMHLLRKVKGRSSVYRTGSGGRKAYRIKHMPPIRLRVSLGNRLCRTLGLLALKIAEAIEQGLPAIPRRDPEQLPGIEQPFAATCSAGASAAENERENQ